VPTVVQSTMKLSNLSAFWPPLPGPHVGFKTIHKEITNRLEIVDLSDLHEGAWWTGFYILAQDTAPGKFNIELAAKDGSCFASWEQDIGIWNPFPWPIPASMAQALGLQLHITTTYTLPFSSWAKCEACFHEMSDIPVHDLLLFVTPANKPEMHWNGALRGGGFSDASLPLYIGAPHRLIYPMKYILNVNPEYIDRRAIPTGWAEPVTPVK
jgi:hypothetical protein